MILSLQTSKVLELYWCITVNFLFNDFVICVLLISLCCMYIYAQCFWASFITRRAYIFI